MAGSLLRLSKELSSRGLKLSLGFSVTLPTNYIPGHDAYSMDKQNALFKSAEEKLNEIALPIKNSKVDKIECGTLGDCISCGLCKTICPAQSIELKAGKPVWLHQCEQCFRCLNYCPKDAIQFGENTMGKKDIKILLSN